MNITDVRLALSNALIPTMREHGFCDRKSDCSFVRRSSEFMFFFKLQVYAKPAWFFTKPLVCVGCATLNKLYNQILQPKDRLPTTGPTVGSCFGVSNNYHDRGDYKIEKADDIAFVAPKIMSDFVDIALPYFEQNKNLESLEKTLNPRAVDGPYAPTTVSAACMGLIAAHLCRRSDFQTMADFHFNFIAKTQRKELAGPIVRVIEYYTKQG
jgi:hypothetical protein